MLILRKLEGFNYTMSKRLFQLVLELDQAEKRYFKRYLKAHSDDGDGSNMGRLFDYITSQNHYDRDKLLTACSFIKPRQLGNNTSRLYKKVLASLRAYHSGKSVLTQIFHLIIDAEILEKKGLYQQALSALQQAEKIALQYEEAGTLSDIYHYQEQLITLRLKAKNHSGRIEDLQSKKQGIVQLNTRILFLRDLRDSAYNVFREHGRTTRDTREIEKIEIRFTKETNEWSDAGFWFEEAIYFSKLGQLIYQLQGDFERALYYNDYILRTIEEKPHLVKARLNDVIRAYCDRVIFLNMLGRFDDSQAMLRTTRMLKEQSDSYETQLLIVENTLFHELEVYLLSRNYKRAVLLVEANLDEIEAIKAMLHNVNRTSKLYRIALAFFGNGDYRKALKWINEILNFDVHRYRKDIQESVLLLNLWVHFKLGNYELVQYRLETSKKVLQQMDRWQKPEQAVFRALNTITGQSKNHQKTLRELEESLGTIFNSSPLDGYFMAYFDLREWLRNELYA